MKSKTNLYKSNVIETLKEKTKMAEEKSTKISMCSVFVSFKSLLFLIYEFINHTIRAIYGKHGILGPKSVKTKADIAGNNNNTVAPRIKEMWEMPGPRRLPFFGTLLTSSELSSADLLKANENREKIYGPMIKEEHFWNYPLIMVLDSDDIKEIARSNPTLRPGMEILWLYRSLNPERYTSHGLVNSQGKMWKTLHDTFTPTITNIRFVRSLLTVHNDIASEVMDDLAKGAKTHNALPNALNSLIAEAAFYTAFGKRMGFTRKSHADSEKLALFWSCYYTYFKAFHKSMYGFPWWKYFSTKTWKEFCKAEDELFKMTNGMVEELLKTGNAGGVLAEVCRDNITQSDLNAVLLEFVTGATPILQASIFTLYWVTKHENVYNRVLEELREQLPKKDSNVTEDVLDNIPYLKACVMESFRIASPACNLARILKQETVVGGYKLPQYTLVILQTWYACMQEKNFYRAKEFLPERWIYQDGVPPYRPHDRHIMLNFGMGTRQCPGQRLARQIMNTFLCKILRRFKLTFTKDIEVQYEWLLSVKQPVYVELEEYES